MARPRRLKSPARLNLMVEADVKNAVILLAAEKGLSIGQLISQMIQGESARALRRNRENGERLGESGKSISNLGRISVPTL